ncbi:MAG: universal stress protein [Calditrichota bacterium]
MAYMNLLVAISCSDADVKVMSQAAVLSQALGAKLTAIHVNDPHAGKVHAMMDTIPRHEEDDIRKHLDNLGFDALASSINIISAEGQHYPEVIAKAAADYDMLIIGHRRKSKMMASLTDSTDERVADLAHNCVMLVPLD